MAAETSIVLQQHSQRISSMEDMLRKNEGSLTLVLSRLREVEQVATAMHRSQSKMQPEIGYIQDEISQVKRRVDGVDSAWRLKANELDQVLVAERTAKNPGVAVQEAKLGADMQAIKTDLYDMQAEMRRIHDLAVADGRNLKQVEQDGKWLMDTLRDQVAQQKDFAMQQARRNDTIQKALQDEHQERDRDTLQIRNVVEGVMKTMREEVSVRIENEAKARLALQSDVVDAFAKMREDIMKGFSQASSNLQQLDETTHSLETVLRAEVRARITSSDDVVSRMELLEDRVKRESSAAADYLKSLDQHMSNAVRDVREVTANECRNQLDHLWRKVNDMAEERRTHLSQREMESRDELKSRKEQVAIENEMMKMRSEILSDVQKSITYMVPPKEQLVTKMELQDLDEKCNTRVEEVRLQVTRLHAPDSKGMVADSQLASIEKRLSAEETKRQELTAEVREAVRKVDDKCVQMDRQAQTMETMHKNLQSAWERDSAQMETYLQGIREQVVLMSEDQRRNAALASGDVATAATTSGQPVPYKLLEDDIETLRKNQRSMEMKWMKDVSELRTTSDTLSQRVDEVQRLATTDIGTLKEDVVANADRVEELQTTLSNDVLPQFRDNMQQFVEEALQKAIEKLDENSANRTPAGS